jgi:hypothetical protein
MRASPSTSLFRRLQSGLMRWQALVLIVANPYRPELHYMRGPGPKCRAKQRALTRIGAA